MVLFDFNPYFKGIDVMTTWTSTYIEITLENDKREMTQNMEDIKKFIPVENYSMSFSSPEEFKKNPNCNNINFTVKMMIGQNEHSLLKMFDDKQLKHIRIYSIGKKDPLDTDDSILNVSDYGDARFLTMNFNLDCPSEIKTETYSVSYISIENKWIESGVVKSSMSSDYKKYL